MSTMSDLAVDHGNPAALIAKWRERAADHDTPEDSIELARCETLRTLADELEAVLDGFALIPADDPAIDRSSSASRQHYIETGRFLTVTESLAEATR